jgi:hypothetical protein
MREVSDLKPFDDILVSSSRLSAKTKPKSPGDNSPAMENELTSDLYGNHQILSTKNQAAAIRDSTGLQHAW